MAAESKDGATSKNDARRLERFGSLSGSLPRGSHPLRVFGTLLALLFAPLFATRREFARTARSTNPPRAPPSRRSAGLGARDHGSRQWSEEELSTAWLCERGGFAVAYLRPFREELRRRVVGASLRLALLEVIFGVDVAAHRARLLDEFGDRADRRLIDAAWFRRKVSQTGRPR